MKKVDPLFDVRVISDREVAHGFGTSEPGNPLGMYVLDEQGEPVPEPDTVQWGQWLEATTETRARTLAETTVGPYWVSTVFLALDHSFGGGPPVLWETMIFGAWEEFQLPSGGRKKCRKDIDQIRYTSKAEALAGHAEAVKRAESLPHPLPGGPGP